LKGEPSEFRLRTSVASASSSGIIYIHTEQGSFHIRPPVSYLRAEYLRLLPKTLKNPAKALVLDYVEPLLYQFRRDLAAGHLQAEVINHTDGRSHPIPAYFWNSDSGEKVLWDDFPACFEVDDQSFGGRAVISLAEAERFSPRVVADRSWSATAQTGSRHHRPNRNSRMRDSRTCHHILDSCSELPPPPIWI
jgi:hypothetical protein